MNTSAFRRLHPLSVLIFAVSALAPALLARPLWAAAAGLAAAVLSGTVQCGSAWVRRSAPLMLLTAVPMVVLTPLFNRTGQTPLVDFPGGALTLEGVVTGAFFALSAATVLAVFGPVSRAMGNGEILYLLSRALPQTSLVLALTVRFIPELERRLDEIRLLRGASGGKASVRTAAANGMGVLNTLMSWSLEDAVVTAGSMRARGYGLSRRRTHYHSYFFGAGSAVFAAAAVSLSAAAALLPRTPGGAAWAVLLAMPLIIEGWDALKWRIYLLRG